MASIDVKIEVSVVTPTYNRRKFIPALIEIYQSQTFPKEKMEWIIIDDGRDSVEDLFIEAQKTIPNIRYVRLDEKLRIGAKRNLLNSLASGDIIVAMDDDDFYPPIRVEAVVTAFKKFPKVDLAGSSEMFMYYTDENKIYSLGPFGIKHATNGTMAWRKRYSDKHKYDEFVTMTEETSFLDNYSHQMIQLDPKDTILVICHSDNTVDKSLLRETHMRASDTIKSKLRLASSMTLSNFVKNPELLRFYQSISSA
jgi:glycosyltransferase involved in cell wall biosynthesis